MLAYTNSVHLRCIYTFYTNGGHRQYWAKSHGKFGNVIGVVMNGSLETRIYPYAAPSARVLIGIGQSKLEANYNQLLYQRYDLNRYILARD